MSLCLRQGGEILEQYFLRQHISELFHSWRLYSCTVVPSCGECRCGGLSRQPASLISKSTCRGSRTVGQWVNAVVCCCQVPAHRKMQPVSQLGRFKNHKKLFGHRQNIMIFALPQHSQVWPFRVWMAQLNESMTASKDVWKSYEIFGSQQKSLIGDWGSVPFIFMSIGWLKFESTSQMMALCLVGPAWVWDPVPKT